MPKYFNKIIFSFKAEVESICAALKSLELAINDIKSCETFKQIILESLDVVAMYDYENDEWGEEGQLTLARGSADATVSKIPRSYWSNKFTFQAPKLLPP